MKLTKSLLLIIVFGTVGLVECEDEEYENDGPEEYYSALVHMEQLLETEIQIVERLDRYLNNEEKRIASLRQISNSYRMQHSIASKDVESYLSNPINAFILVKRLSSDWKWVESFINTDQKHLKEFLEYKETFPSSEDLAGAAEALHRLQVTYDLDTTMMANGIIPQKYIVEITNSSELTTNNAVSIPLTADDCFEIGRQAYNFDDHKHTYLWMKEAWKRVNTEPFLDFNKNFNERIEILEYLAYSAYKIDNIQEAYNLTVKLLQMNPEHGRGLSNLDFFNSLLNSNNRNEYLNEYHENGSILLQSDFNSTKVAPKLGAMSRMDEYELLCRGDNRMSESVRSKLVCFYLDTTKLDPYLRISKIKVEEVYRQPQIVIFYDIMSDKENEIIRSLSKPQLKRATVFGSEGSLVTKSRVSKSAWFEDSYDVTVNKISMRIQAITGLDVSTAEELQVVNYGIGGHYLPHYDYTGPDDSQHGKFEFGNRFATWINYMSDVTAGGATVFPDLGVAVWPKKNSAAFWYNLMGDGEGDELTMHAACPVLVGTKWVSNKWIHERGQEFRKPCNHNDKYFYIQQV